MHKRPKQLLIRHFDVSQEHFSNGSVCLSVQTVERRGDDKCLNCGLEKGGTCNTSKGGP